MSINVVKLKGCSKCQGDLVRDFDCYGIFVKCLQCGKIYDNEISTNKPPEIPQTDEAVEGRRMKESLSDNEKCGRGHELQPDNVENRLIIGTGQTRKICKKCQQYNRNRYNRKEQNAFY